MPFLSSPTVIASPPLAAETVVAQVVGVSTRGPGQPVLLIASVDITIGTSGTGLTLTWRRGATTAGVGLGGFGPETVVAASRYVRNFIAVDANPPEEQNATYSFDITVAAGAATSTVNSVSVAAIWGF